MGEQSTVLDIEVEEDDSKVIRNEKVDMTRFIKEIEEENVVDWKRRIRDKTETDCELESKITDSNSDYQKNSNADNDFLDEDKVNFNS